MICQLPGPSASLPMKPKAKCLCGPHGGEVEGSDGGGALSAALLVLSKLDRSDIRNIVHLVAGAASAVLHGESNTSQESPRMTIQRMCQPQEAVQP